MESNTFYIMLYSLSGERTAHCMSSITATAERCRFTLTQKKPTELTLHYNAA